VRNPDDGAKLVDEIKALGRRALAVQLDLADLPGVRAGIAQSHKHFGRIDALVNNVGLGPENLAENVREEDFDLTVNINLKGTFFTTQAVAKLMMAQKSGRIINISSQAGSVVLKGEAIYCMSKAAINHLTRCLAFEWASYGITVNSVSPTFISTDGTAPALADPQFRQQVLSHIPLGRIGNPIDVAGTVVFLASPAASLITGANILVDGGWSVA
jgi:NAD(P)-dependent dehydrogenase (short-subunit alcohol dehydrogenase family)